MKLQDQVCTLEQAKRLTELGIVCEAYFNWTIYPETKYRRADIMLTNPHNREGIPDMGETYPAFTVAELGVMLPDGADCFGKHWAQFQTFRVIKGVQPSQQWCCYCDESSPSGVNDQGDDYYKVAKKVYGHTEAEARATMLIYLLENRLITAEDCNKRLTQ